MNLLIATPDADVRNKLEQAFAASGHTLTFTADVREFQTLLNTHDYDLLVLDEALQTPPPVNFQWTHHYGDANRTARNKATPCHLLRDAGTLPRLQALLPETDTS